MTKKFATVFNNNHTYLIGAFTLFSLFGIILLLLSVITKDIDWLYGGIAVLIISLLIWALIMDLAFYAIMRIIEDKKIKKQEKSTDTE